MGRKERSPEEQEHRVKIRELLQLSKVRSMDDIQDLFKETIAEFMEAAWTRSCPWSGVFGYQNHCFLYLRDAW